MLPVSWENAPALLFKQLDDDVVAVLAFGMSLNSRVISLEKIAVNECDISSNDVDGKRAISPQVRPGGPPSYLSTLPVEDLLRSLNAHGIPAQVSTNAGRFLCNYVFYTLMDRLAEKGRTIPAGFIHLPPFSEEGGIAKEIQSRAVALFCAHLDNAQ